MRTLALVIMQLAFWLILSGEFSLPGSEGWTMILGMGIFSTFLVTFLAARMELIDGNLIPDARRVVAWALYMPWLMWEIILSNIDVAKLVWHPSQPISPKLVRVPYKTKTPLCTATYANSITLTPGTVTLLVEKDYILVHAITQDAADALESGEMHRRVLAIEGEVIEGNDSAL